MRNAWAGGLDPTINSLTAGSVEPTDGASIAAMATGAGNRMLTTGGGNAPVVAAAPGPGTTFALGSPVLGFATVVVLIVLAWWAAHENGEESEFANLKATFFNVTMVTLIAIAGIPLVKVAFVSLENMGVPFADHLSAWAMAA